MTSDNEGGGQWELLPELAMDEARAGCQVASGPDGRVYVLGGGPNGQVCSETMVALDMRCRRWEVRMNKCNNNLS